MELLLLAFLISAALVGWWHWENNVKQVPLKEFGQENVMHVLSFESESVQKSILKRGSMTRAQWIGLLACQQKSINDELKRRDAKN